jgi:tetratricopeptide (TPR) repeat protein
MIIHKQEKKAVKIWILAVIVICMASTAVFALGSSPKKEASASNAQEIENNNKTTVMVGMTKEQKEGFERTWKKTQPRWEAEESARRLEKQGLINEAIEEYKRAISIGEADLYVKTSHRALARLYEQTGEYAAAVKELDWLIEHFQKMNYPNKDLLNEYIATRNRLASISKSNNLK